MNDLITEEWLRSIGMKWEQRERSPCKHWLLWLAPACIDPGPDRRLFACSEDLGIELTFDPQQNYYFCWIRADYAGRYCRFLHVRHMTRQEEVVKLIEALTGRTWVPADVLYGAFRSPEQAEDLRKDSESLHQRLAAEWGKRIEAELGITDTDKREVLRP